MNSGFDYIVLDLLETSVISGSIGYFKVTKSSSLSIFLNVALKFNQKTDGSVVQMSNLPI